MPRTVDVCRCGQEWVEAAWAAEPEPAAAPASRSQARLLIGGVAIIAVIAAGAWFAGESAAERESPTSPASAPSAQSADDPARVIPVESVKSPDGTKAPAVAERRMAWPEDLDVWREPPSEPVTARPIELRPAAARPLEDVVAEASAAVVLVETAGGRGAGFFVAPDAVLTNAHVVGANAYVTLKLAAGESLPARVSARREDLDLAVIRLAAPRQHQRLLPLARGPVRVGQEVFAIGSPLGLQNTVTRGIVSGLRRAGDVLLVQTDAAINPGNSGGPILDREGRVVAVATLKVGGNAEALGFGVAAEHAAALLEGRAAPSTSLPVRQASTPLAPEPEEPRLDATAMYEHFIRQAAQQADRLDRSWDDFVHECLGGRAPRTRGERGWFVLWERFDESAVPPTCVRFYVDFQAAAREFHARMTQANDAARRGGVYPGVCRDLRRQHRLDSPDW